MLTEVYGYARSRRVIWAGFAAIADAVIYTIVGELPPPPTGRIKGLHRHRRGGCPASPSAGLFAFWAGEFCNNFRAGPPQDPDRRTPALDAHHRLDHRRRGKSIPASSSSSASSARSRRA
ncbi:MAG: hypothetical protein U0841_10850 [Chloroflexia bacterium]